MVTDVAVADCEAPDDDSAGCELAPPQAVRPRLTVTRAARVGSRRVFFRGLTLFLSSTVGKVR
jgi:hypothetical protein